MIIEVKDFSQKVFSYLRAMNLKISTSHPLLSKHLSPTENDASSPSLCDIFFWGALEVRLDQKNHSYHGYKLNCQHIHKLRKVIVLFEKKSFSAWVFTLV